MKTSLLRTAAGLTALAAGLAGAQTYSGYPTYGYGNQSGIVRCESINSRTNFCRVDTRGGVQLHRQLSRENCIRGRNWDVRYDGIVVDDGCRAEFALGSAYRASTGTIIGTDRYGRPIYSTRGTYGGTYGGGYATDRYGRPIYDTRSGGYGSGGYSSGGYSNGGYTYDQYGNRIYVGTGGVYDDGYTYDQYGNRVYMGSSGSGGYYTTDRYGNRVWVPSRSTTGSGGYYATDRYGNRVWVEQSGSGRVYDDDYDTADRVYDNNQALGYPGTVSTYPGTVNTYPQVITGGTTSTSTTYSTGAIHCQPAATGKTYCGDRNRTYTMKYDAGANCALNRTYGRDSGGFWVAAGCSMTLEPSRY